MKTVRLGDICDIVSGGTPSRSKPEFWQGGTIPWIKIGNIKGKYVLKADEFITKEGLDGSSAKMLSKGTILYTIFATLGEVGILDIDACTNQAIAGITIRQSSKVLADYLYYYLKSQRGYVNDIGRGVAQNNINLSILRGFEVPLPTTNVQEKMVSILDKVTAIIVAHQQQLVALDELIKARFVEIFGDIKTNVFLWDRCKFGDVTKKITDGEHGTVPRVEAKDGYLYLMARNITKDGTLDLSETSYVPPEVHSKIYKRCNPEPNDLLLVCVGATIGKCTVVPSNIGEFSMARSVALLKPDFEKVTSQFLINLLRSDAIQRDIEKSSHAAAQAGLYTNMIVNLDAFLPPIDLQKKFDAFVVQVEKTKAAVQKALDEARLLFDSLMQQYFG